MRVLLAGLYHETHCFVSEQTRLEDFKVERGDAVAARRGDGSTIDGFLEVADRLGWDVLPAATYAAMPSGRVDDNVLEAFWVDIERALTTAAGSALSAVFLSLHGAMVSRSFDDVEGELLTRLRKLPGTARLPIFGVFDLHANFTQRMAEGADCLICYRENPHTDARASAVRAAELLGRCLNTGVTPRMRRRNPPIIWPPTGTGTADTPMRDLEALAREIEVQDPAIWAINVVAGFSFADVEDVGVSFSVVGQTSPEQEEGALDRLEQCATRLRNSGLVSETRAEDVLAAVRPDANGPILLVEPSDNIGGGAPGDGTGVLRAFVRHNVDRAAVVINDPEAIRAIADLPPGSAATLAIGGKGSTFDAGPLTLRVEIVAKSDGRFELEDVHSHLAAMQGRFIDMGPCAVVRHGGITILLTSRKTPPFDLGQLRSQGIEPEAFAFIGVKAAVAHRRAYDPIATASYTVATPGPCISDPCALPYSRARRPIFPLDQFVMEPS